MATMTLRIYDSVRERILKGELAPGSRLVIRSLALEHETSDIPIREALRMLERDGLVEIRPYRGARVVNLSPEEIEEGYLIRGHLESLATRTAVGHLTDQHFAQLDRCLRDMGKALDRGDGLGYAEINREFHGLIFSASPHRRLQELIENIWDGQRGYQMVFRLAPDWQWTSYQEHQQIVQALREGDADAAAEIALEHKLAAGRALIAGIREDLAARAEEGA
ncbi:DNA-binding GntR family transcriptional regulator [Jiangella mangrovi]|uniref:DNA-binding GntR family transcriptional regulator n=2 Tax=Jiangella mangrovi TaxID=1524084 RepID=A0A7W9GS07_9ACTN|nr:DNA-binding GntR family transcriptional regulator [Jiangella mangrovi]